MRPGNDVTVVAYSITVGQALEAAEKLAADGIDAEVIDLRSLRPLDMDTVLESVKKTNRIVTIEQGRLIEDGTHEALVRADGRYAQLWRLQSGDFSGMQKQIGRAEIRA